MKCINCKSLSFLSDMGYRYCKKEQRFGRIQDVRIAPAWCPKNAKHNPAPEPTKEGRAI